jgi:hypothetical protein
MRRFGPALAAALLAALTLACAGLIQTPADDPGTRSAKRAARVSLAALSAGVSESAVRSAVEEDLAGSRRALAWAEAQAEAAASPAERDAALEVCGRALQRLWAHDAREKDVAFRLETPPPSGAVACHCRMEGARVARTCAAAPES